MTNYNYSNTSQYRNFKSQELGADALLMADFIEDMEAVKPSYNKYDFENAKIENTESNSTLNYANEIHYYNEIAQREYDKQNVRNGDISQPVDNTKTNTSFLTIFPSPTIHSAF